MFRFANMLVLKITRDCNLRCSYCYIKDKDNYRGEIMDFQLYKKIIDRVAHDKTTLQKKDQEPTFSLVFHGGEPTIVGYDRMAMMLEYATVKFKSIGMKYALSIQTNMTLLDEEMLALFRKYNMNMGASFDGINKGNEGRTKVVTEQSFIDKIDMVHDYNLNIGFLLVANKMNIDTAYESKDYMEKELGAKGVKINYAEDVLTEGQGVEVTGTEYYEKILLPSLEEFLKTGQLKEENLSIILEKFITESISTDRGRASYNCNGKVCSAGINIVEVNPDGSFYYCGRYSEDFPEAYLMDIDDHNFLAMKQVKRYVDFVEEKHKALNEVNCDTCYADGICDHGCMAFHFSKYKRYGIRKELVCDIYKPLYKWLVKNQHEMILALEKKVPFPYIMRPYYPIKTIDKSSMFINNLDREGITVEILPNSNIQFSRRGK